MPLDRSKDDSLISPPDLDMLGRLDEKVHGCKSVSDLLAVLNDLDTYIGRVNTNAAKNKSQLSREPSDAYFLLQDVFQRLQEVTLDDPAAGKEVLCSMFLPRLLHDTDVQKERYFIAWGREDLVRWIEQYEEPHRAGIRMTVLDLLLPRIMDSHQDESQSTLLADRYDPKSVIWLCMSIGYRRPDLVEALKSVGRRFKGEVGDTALNALAHLGVTREDTQNYKWLLSALHLRARTRWNLPLDAALCALGSSITLPVIEKYWFSENTSVTGIDPFSALRVPAQIADQNSENPVVQEQAWEIITQLFTTRPQEYSRHVYLGGDVAPLCDSVKVIPILFEQLRRAEVDIRVTNQEQESLESQAPEAAESHDRDTLYHRMNSCTRPRQLLGWKTVHDILGTDDAILVIVEDDACQDTKLAIRFQTSESRTKLAAWETALNAGCYDALSLEWFERAVVGETNPYDQAKVMELLACFRLDPLPAQVLDWVTSYYDAKIERKESGDAEFSARLAATELTRSGESEESFTALLNLGLVLGEQLLMDSGQALSDVAISLTRGGNSNIERMLIDVALRPAATRFRTVAIFALERLALAGLLSSHVISGLETLVLSRDLPDYELSVVIGALGYVLGNKPELPLEESDVRHEGAPVADVVLEKVLDLAQQNGTDSDLGKRSLHTLVHLNILQQETNLLTEVLGLQHGIEKDTWDIQVGVVHPEETATVIGILYHQQPAAFTPAVSSLLLKYGYQDWWAVRALLRTIGFHHNRTQRVQVPEPIRAGLVKQAYLRQSTGTSDTGILRLLARICPDEFLNEKWELKWADWLPNSRVAMAEALREFPITDPEVSEPGQSKRELSAVSIRINTLLVQLMGDGQYAIRRSAYRALAQQDSLMLQALLYTWSRADELDLRKRAAEASAWLESEPNSRSTFDELSSILARDPEPSVRTIMKRAYEERRKRLWAREYLQYVLDANDNDAVLSSWRYGSALTHVGDDTTIDALETVLSDDKARHPLHVKYWLSSLLKDLKENWEKVTRKWTEHWSHWEGDIKHGTGIIRLPNGDALLTTYTLWQLLPPGKSLGPEQKLSWGGTAVVEGMFHFVGGMDYMLEVEDKQGAKIFIKGSTLGQNDSTTILDFLGESLPPF